MSNRIRVALKPLTSGKSPAIKLKNIVVTHSGGETYKEVEYFNNLTQTLQTVKA